MPLFFLIVWGGWFPIIIIEGLLILYELTLKPEKNEFYSKVYSHVVDIINENEI